jgi:hypothetical protein
METGSQSVGSPAGDDQVEPGGYVAALAGVSGRIRVVVEGRSLGVLRIDGGYVDFLVGAERVEASTTLHIQDGRDARLIQTGALNPIVASLQGRLVVEGDLALAVRVMLGLQTGSPFNGKGRMAKG